MNLNNSQVTLLIIKNKLEHFDYLALKVNNKKIEKAVPKLVQMVENNSYINLKKMRCFPWLEQQLIEAKQLAYELLISYEKERIEVNSDKNIKNNE